MNRALAALTVGLCVLPSVAFSGWLDKKEQVVLTSKVSVKPSIDDDTYLKSIVITSKVDGLCKDTFIHAFSRNVIGANSKTLAVLTYDSIPILKMEYDEKSKNCRKTYIIEKDLTGYTLTSNTNRQHKFNLVYAYDTEVTTLSNILNFGTPLIAATSPAGILIASPITKQATEYFDKALTTASSTHDDHTADFQLPDQENQTKLTLTATIGLQPFVLMELYLEVKKSLLDAKNHQAVMNTKLDGPLTVQDALVSRRSKEEIIFKSGDYGLVKNECSYLKNSYQSTLNQLDLQRLQEAYLLNNHRGKIGLGTLEQCFGYPIKNPNSQLTFKILADEATPAPQSIDTHFVKLLTSGEHAKILTKNANFNNQDTELEISSIATYIKLKNKSTPLCHSYIGNRQVAFMQMIGSHPYYLTASIDQEYTIQQASKGKLSKINNISISKTPDQDYEGIGEVTQCINNWNQSRKVASGW